MNIYSPAKKFKDWIEKCAILIAFRWIGRYILFWLLSIFKKKNFFLKIQNGRKIQYGRNLAKIIHDFFVAKPLNEMC
jgi:hypothetical protein